MVLQVTFRNLTDEPIVAQIHPRNRTETRAQLVLQPSCRLTTSLPKGELSLYPHARTLARTDKDVQNSIFKKSLALEERRIFDSVEDKISLSSIFRRPWNVLHTSKWRIFSFKVRNSTCRTRVQVVIYYPQVTRRHHQIVILLRRNLASFLADMPDHVPLSSLLLPGV